jgi:AcrR family transcriptional regulator
MAVSRQSKSSSKSDRRVSSSLEVAAPAEQSPGPAPLTSVPSTSDQKGPRKRREQARAIETREVILDAALSEFAERGYDAASIRNIANRTGIKHPLITYHYPTKEVLWQAVAEDAFSHIEAAWREADPLEARSPVEAVRLRYEIFLQFTLRHPDFHHFMLRENTPRNPRLPWLVKTILQPLMDQILPDISLAQKAGDLHSSRKARLS